MATPLNRCSEIIDFHPNGRPRRVRCWSPANPHYYQTEVGSLLPIEIGDVAESVGKTGQIGLRSRNVVSCGLRRDGTHEKYLGLRPDFNQALGSEQLEFSIERVEFDGQAVGIDTSKSVALNVFATDLGGVVVTATRRGCRQAVKIEKPINDFQIVYRIHLKNLEIKYRPDLDEHWVYSVLDGGFRFRLRRPLLLDAETFEPLANAEGEPLWPGMVHREMVQDGGDWLYTKYPGPGFDPKKLPEKYLLDAETVYSTTADGYVWNSNADWSTCRNAATGDTVNTSGTLVSQAFGANAGYTIRRSFFYFDVSVLSGSVAAATINIFGVGRNSAAVCIQLGTQADPLSTADYDAFSGNLYDSIDPWDKTNYNIFTLNAQGRSDLQGQVGSGIFKICVRDYSQDYLNVEGTNASSGCYFANNTGTDYDPYLELELAGGTTITISAATITATGQSAFLNRTRLIGTGHITVTGQTVSIARRFFQRVLRRVLWPVLRKVFGG